MVFQNYALYPHMTVYENMAFGLRIKKTDKSEIDRRVHEAAGILDIEKILERKPKALSVGQRQRVAVGRAIVRQPKVFLFDEPLSNLDAKLRVQMRTEISSLHHRLDATMIYVTHDQVEAMTMADKIVVYKDGKIQQIGSPLHLYNHPGNKFVAGFIGSPPMNFLTVTVLEEDGHIVLSEGGFILNVHAEHEGALKEYEGSEVYLGIRPEDLLFNEDDGAANSIPLTVSVVEPLGADTTLWLNTKTQTIAARTDPTRIFKVDDSVNFVPRMEKARYFDKETELAILPLPDSRPALPATPLSQHIAP
jgi:multiple sugar transport system ATP-binding protein